MSMVGDSPLPGGDACDASVPAEGLAGFDNANLGETTPLEVQRKDVEGGRDDGDSDYSRGGQKTSSSEPYVSDTHTPASSQLSTPPPESPPSHVDLLSDDEDTKKRQKKRQKGGDASNAVRVKKETHSMKRGRKRGEHHKGAARNVTPC